MKKNSPDRKSLELNNVPVLNGMGLEPEGHPVGYALRARHFAPTSFSLAKGSPNPAHFLLLLAEPRGISV